MKIGIFGAGPVGLTLALQLKKFNIDFKLFEKFSTVRTHYINSRTMETFSNLYNISDEIKSKQESLMNFRYYKYVKKIGDFNNFAVKDQLQPSLHVLSYYIKNNLCNEIFVHIPQTKLLQILLMKNMEINKEDIYFNKEFIEANIVKDKINVQVLNNNDRQIKQYEFDYIIATDGAKSIIRNSQNIQMKGGEKMMKFFNIYFKSKELSRLLIKNKENAFLHFVYNSKIIGCLINYSYKDGEFGIHIPITEIEKQYFQENLQNTYVVKQMIKSMFVDHFDFDIQIQYTGFWELNNVIAETLYKNKIILCGDSGHQVPPSGGFGMNSGIEDAFQLSCKLLEMQIQKTKSDELLQRYSNERINILKKIKRQAQINLDKTINVAKKIGLDPYNLSLLEGFTSILPNQLQQGFFGVFKKFGTIHLEKDKKYKIDEKDLIDLNYFDLEFKSKIDFYQSQFQLKVRKNDQVDKFKGKLCPHILIQDKYNNINNLSLRQLFELDQNFIHKMYIIITDLCNFQVYIENYNLQNCIILQQKTQVDFICNHLKFQMKQFAEIFNNPQQYILVIRRDQIIDSMNYISHNQHTQQKFQIKNTKNEFKYFNRLDDPNSMLSY